MSFIRDMFLDGWYGVILGILLIACVVLLGFVLCFIGYQIADKYGLPIEKGTGMVVEKKFIPAHDDTRLVPAGKVILPMKTREPNNWSLCIQVDEGKCSYASVTKDFYDSIPETVQTKLNIGYVRGRFSHEVFIKWVSLP